MSTLFKGFSFPLESETKEIKKPYTNVAHDDTGSDENRRPAGSREDRVLVCQSLKNRFMPATRLKIVPSTNIVRQRLCGANFLGTRGVVIISMNNHPKI